MSRPAVRLVLLTVATLVGWRLCGPRERLEALPIGREVIDNRPLPEGVFARLDADPYVGPVARVLFSPDGKHLAAAMKDKSIRVWSVARRKLLYEIPDAAGQQFAFSPDSQTLATAVEASTQSEQPRHNSPVTLTLRQAATGRRLADYGIAGAWEYMSFSADGRGILTGAARSLPQHAVSLLDLESGDIRLLPIKGTPPKDFFINPAHMDFSPLTWAYAVSSWGELPVLFDGRTGECVVLPAKMSNNAAVRISPDGKTVATMGGERLKLFTVPDGTPLPVPVTSSVDECRFSPDCQTVAYIEQWGRRVCLLSLADGKFAPSLESPETRPTSLAFTPHGNGLATGNDDGSILLWETGGSDRPAHATETEAREAADQESSLKRPRATSVSTRLRSSVNADKMKYVFGEPIALIFELRNTGRRPHRFEVGGDYRGATRHISYSVDAIHEDGSAAVDPHPQQTCMGGIMHEEKLLPGGSWKTVVPLLDYRRLDKPGRYRVRVSCRGPVAETSIDIRNPTREEAKRLVEEMDDRFEKTRREHQNAVPSDGYATMTHPAYRELLVARAKAGNIHVLEALGGMPDPEATKALIALLEHPYPAFVEVVEEQLYMRLPDPDLDGRVRPGNIFRDDFIEPRKYLRDAAWRSEFAAPVRAHAKRCLAIGDDPNLYRGAFFLSCVGTADDLPALLTGFDIALNQFQSQSPEGRNGFERRIACPEMHQAVQMMIRRGAPIPAAPKTGAEKILFAEAITRRPDFRPRDWDATFADLLRDRLDYVRQAGVACIPKAPPDRVAAVVPDLLNDIDPLVRQAALKLAEQVPVPAWKPAVVAALSGARTEQAFWEANAAAKKYCTSFELTELYVERILDRETAKSGLEALMKIFHDTSGAYPGQSLDVPKVRQSCHAAWRRFIVSHREQLKTEGPFSVMDPIPKDELFPSFVFLTPLEFEEERRRRAEFQKMWEKD